MINQISSTPSDASSITRVQSRSHSIPPPETKDEWFMRESITEWPVPLKKRDHTDNISAITDSVDAIESDLKKHASNCYLCVCVRACACVCMCVLRVGVCMCDAFIDCSV